MKLGIVGAEAAKFTAVTEAAAKEQIRKWIEATKPTHIVSGHCHLGGVDIWAEEIAAEYELPTLIFPPKELSWEKGYKPRNLEIAKWSDHVICIVVKDYPPDYKGMRFKNCYHCVNNMGMTDYQAAPHVKSGGCWTMYKARSGTLVVV